MAGVWFKTQEDASLDQHAMDCDAGAGLAVSYPAAPAGSGTR
jgi:hypothetical protein